MSGKFRQSLSATVLKAMSIFTGVQSVNILCSIIRTKVVAICIGPVGVGLITLYNSVMEMLSSTAQLNINQSAVRDISAADTASLPRVIHAVRRWSLILGVAGLVLTCVASPLLSQLTFGDTAHWWAFSVLSAIVLCGAVSGGRLAILRGMGQLGRLAQASMWGAVGGTAVALPMYIFFGISGIIPSLIAFAVSTLVASLILSKHNIAISKGLTMSWAELWQGGRGFLALGVYMTISATVTQLMSYVFVLWLNSTSGTATVGLYQAGFTLVSSYVGVIFTALSMEYYPRLVSVAERKVVGSIIVSHEMSLVLWILLPVVIIFIAGGELIVNLLYSSDFEAALPYVVFAVTGMIWRGISYCMAYVILARGDGKIYIVTEIASAIIGLSLNVAFYTLWGFIGLGCAYILWYAFYTAIVWIVYRYRYGMRISIGVLWQQLFCIIVVAAALTSKALVGWWAALAFLALVLPVALRSIIRR